MSQVASRVTLYKDYLVIETVAEKSIPGELVVPGDDNSSLGVVAMNLKLVGVSKEAYEAMTKLYPGSDGLGAIDCWETQTNGEDGWAFGYLGVLSLVDVREPDHDTTSRQWTLAPFDCFTEIDNVSPEGAIQAVDLARA